MAKSKKYYTDEFYRIADSMIAQGDIDAILDLVPFDRVKAFVDDWHSQDDT